MSSAGGDLLRLRDGGAALHTKSKLKERGEDKIDHIIAIVISGRVKLGFSVKLDLDSRFSLVSVGFSSSAWTSPLRVPRPSPPHPPTCRWAQQLQ